ncbi:hypothetical protein NDU88_004709, partial [Pleurodeles waltl]
GKIPGFPPGWKWGKKEHFTCFKTAHKHPHSVSTGPAMSLAHLQPSRQLFYTLWVFQLQGGKVTPSTQGYGAPSRVRF